MREMDDVPHESISPELVLVDPELAARVRASAVAGPTLLADPPRPRAEAAEPSTSGQPGRAPRLASPPLHDDRGAIEPAGRSTGRGQFVTRSIKLAGVLGVAAILGAAFLPPRHAPHLGPSPSAATVPPTLSWRSVGGVRYRVEIFSATHLVYSATTTRTRLDIPHPLAPGRYTWRVTLENRQGGEANRALETGWFVSSAAR